MDNNLMTITHKNSDISLTKSNSKSYRKSSKHFTLSTHDLYRKKRKTAQIHQILFFSFAFLFFLLSTLIFFFSPNPHFSLIFQQNLLLKFSISLFTFLLGVGSTLLACSIKPTLQAAEEIILKQIERTERHISDVYRKKRMKNPCLNQGLRIQSHYYRTLDKIQRHKEKSLNFLSNLTLTNCYNSLTEDWLIHEAIFELNEKLDKVLYSFIQNLSFQSRSFYSTSSQKYQIKKADVILQSSVVA